MYSGPGNRIGAEAIPAKEHVQDGPAGSISVIIPVYNGAGHIAETLDSILAQTARPAEILVIDDGSSDRTADIVREFPSPVSLISTPNRGPAAARNTGACAATSRWLAFCDHDDLWLPTKLERQLGLAAAAPDVRCVLTDFADFTNGRVAPRSHLSFVPPEFWQPESLPAGLVIRHSITARMTTFQPGITSATLVDRDFFHQIGGFDIEATNSAEDTCFHFRCLSHAPFAVVPEVLMLYRRHPAAWSADATRQLHNTVLVWEHILAKYPQAQPHRSDLQRGLAALRKEAAVRLHYQRRERLKRMLSFQ